MSNEVLEKLIMNLIMNSGNARSLAMEAVHCAKSGSIADAKQKIEEAEEFLNYAHETQTQLLFKEAQGENFSLSLLLTHSQDHLMSAISTIDLAKEMIELWEFSRSLKGKEEKEK